MDALVTKPTWIFLVMLLIILLAPVILRRLRVPHIIGLILAGLLVGPGGLNVLARDASIEVFGQVGIYYIMFLAGLEIDMGSFRRHGRKGLQFGLLTFLIPLLVGFVVGHWGLGLSISSSLVLSSLLSSHTLVTYPIIGRYGLGRHPSVVYSIVATAFATFAALLLLAVEVRGVRGDFGGWHWVGFALAIVAYVLFTGYLFPKVGRLFLRRNEDAVTQFVFVLVLVFVSAFLASCIGLEGLLGAFLAGLVLNRIIPRGGPLMVRLEFVGNAIFIPYFLIGVGMIIDVKVLFGEPDTLWLSLVVVSTAVASKWLAAVVMQKMIKGNLEDRRVMFGLTNSHAAGALAIVMIATDPEVQLMDSQMLNATVLLILFSCIISSLETGMAARRLALQTTETERNRGSYHGKCLTAYAYPQTVDTLTQLSIMIRNPHIPDSLMGLAVSMDDDPDDAVRMQGQDNLERARQIAAAADVQMSTMSRVSSNVASAIVHTMREVDAGEVILGLHETPQGQPAGKLGVITQSILATTHREVMLVRLGMPPGTVRRIVVAVPPQAEYEVGFYKWLEHLCRIGEQTGQQMRFHTCGNTGFFIKEYLNQAHPVVIAENRVEKGFGSMLLGLKDEVNADHLLIIISSRPGFISYTAAFNSLPSVIARNFAHTNLILLYPDQYGDPQETHSIFAPNGQSVTQRQVLFEEWLQKLKK
ncbi:MAG: cation:proton antiporter [Bacteroidaceae bacterium]|nr:cation:proton antiporter [Bacteroidaceae bacterium]